MHFGKFNFGSLEIDGNTYEHDVVIDHGEIRNKLLVLPTTEAIEALKQNPKDTNAILHVTC